LGIGTASLNGSRAERLIRKVAVLGAGTMGSRIAAQLANAQIQVLLLTNAVTNACEWAVGFHSFLAIENGIAASDVDAIRNGGLPAEPKSAALSNLARTLIETRGRLTEADVGAFLQAGFDESRLLEVIAVIAASAITNYTGSVTRPALEPPFDAYAWVKP